MVHVLAISATQWRVSDPTLSQNDARSLLGFIERKGTQFEVMKLSRGFEWFTCDSLAEATALLARPQAGLHVREHVMAWHVPKEKYVP